MEGGRLGGRVVARGKRKPRRRRAGVQSPPQPRTCVHIIERSGDRELAGCALVLVLRLRAAGPDDTEVGALGPQCAGAECLPAQAPGTPQRPHGLAHAAINASPSGSAHSSIELYSRVEIETKLGKCGIRAPKPAACRALPGAADIIVFAATARPTPPPIAIVFCSKIHLFSHHGVYAHVCSAAVYNQSRPCTPSLTPNCRPVVWRWAV